MNHGQVFFNTNTGLYQGSFNSGQAKKERKHMQDYAIFENKCVQCFYTTVHTVDELHNSVIQKEQLNFFDFPFSTKVVPETPQMCCSTD